MSEKHPIKVMDMTIKQHEDEIEEEKENKIHKCEPMKLFEKIFDGWHIYIEYNSYSMFGNSDTLHLVSPSAFERHIPNLIECPFCEEKL